MRLLSLGPTVLVELLRGEGRTCSGSPVAPDLSWLLYGPQDLIETTALPENSVIIQAAE